MKALILWSKEIKIGFSTAISYAVFTAYLLVVGYIFLVITWHISKSALNFGGLNVPTTEALFRPLYHDAAIMLLFFSPALTMKLFAEERRTGSLELLFTYPFRDSELVFGKFL